MSTSNKSLCVEIEIGKHAYLTWVAYGIDGVWGPCWLWIWIYVSESGRAFPWDIFVIIDNVLPWTKYIANDHLMSRIYLPRYLLPEFVCVCVCVMCMCTHLETISRCMDKCSLCFCIWGMPETDERDAWVCSTEHCYWTHSCQDSIQELSTWSLGLPSTGTLSLRFVPWLSSYSVDKVHHFRGSWNVCVWSEGGLAPERKHLCFLPT